MYYIGIVAGGMQVEGKGVTTICRYGQVVEAGCIAQERIVGILQFAGAINSKIEAPGIVGPELKGAIGFHVGRYLPYLRGDIVTKLCVGIPTSGRSIA